MGKLRVIDTHKQCAVCNIEKVAEFWKLNNIIPPRLDIIQCFVFRVRHHPLVHEYQQCTTIGTFESTEKVRPGTDD